MYMTLRGAPFRLFHVFCTGMCRVSKLCLAYVCRYSTERNSAKILADNMFQRHLCPTAPDTLACFPYVDKDPFILRETPHLYFVGNQAEFAEQEVVDGDRSVKVVSIPAFAKTGVIVLVDLETLACSPVTFDASLT